MITVRKAPLTQGFNWAPHPISYYYRPELGKGEYRSRACLDQAWFNLLYLIHHKCDLKHKGQMAFDEEIAKGVTEILYEEVREMLYEYPATFIRFATATGLAGDFKEEGLGKAWNLIERNWRDVQNELMPPAKNVRIFPRKVA